MLNLSTLQYPKSKLVILALLALNAVFFAFVDSLISTADAVVWLLLLLVYELESNDVPLPLSAAAMQQLRNLLIAVIVLVFFGYVFTGELLDALNSMLWFALVAMLEFEVRWPERASEYEKLFWLATILTFLGLIAMAGLWLWLGDWLDAYDALLWIAAFGFIEVDIFHFLQRKQSAA